MKKSELRPILIEGLKTCKDLILVESWANKILSLIPDKLPGNLIGRKVKGFRYEGYSSPWAYDPRMTPYLGVVGTIELFHPDTNFYEVRFDDRQIWQYPASEIHQHLIEDPEPKQITKKNVLNGFLAAMGIEIQYKLRSADRPIMAGLPSGYNFKESEKDQFISGFCGYGNTKREALNDFISKLNDYEFVVFGSGKDRKFWKIPTFQSELAKLSEPEFSFKCEDGKVITNEDEFVWYDLSNGKISWKYVSNAKELPQFGPYFSTRELAEASIKPAFELVCRDGVCNDPEQDVYYISIHNQIHSIKALYAQSDVVVHFSTQSAAESYLESLKIGYEADHDYYGNMERTIKKGDIVVKRGQWNNYLHIDDVYCTGPSLPAELVKKYFKPVYRKTSN